MNSRAPRDDLLDKGAKDEAVVTNDDVLICTMPNYKHSSTNEVISAPRPLIAAVTVSVWRSTQDPLL